MYDNLFPVIWASGLFIGMLLLLEGGRRIGMRNLARDPGNAKTGSGATEGAVMALLGLLVAFSVSTAGQRFEARRQFIVEETNNIGTAWLRLDVLAAGAQPALRENFRRYLDARIEMYQKLHELAEAQQEYDKAGLIQKEIWQQAVAGVRTEGSLPQAATVLLPALNAMIDITTTRYMAMKMHPPVIVFVILVAAALLSALFAGYGMTSKTRSWLHMFGFAFIISLAFYFILDLEYPRAGFVRVDSFDQALIDLRKQMAE